MTLCFSPGKRYAHRLKITQPRTGELREFTAPLPADLIAVIHCLRTGESAVQSPPLLGGDNPSW
jgi:hypothetical protein